LAYGGVLSGSAKTRRVPDHVIQAVLQDACSAGCSEKEMAEYRRRIKTEFHDLNADKVLELFVYIDHTEFCGVGFNCSFWIFQRRGNGHRLLLKDYPVVRTGKGVTKGYRDLESQGRMGGCLFDDGRFGREIYLTVFKWNGKEYRPRVVGAQCRRN
jgi:hypothetical protein